MLILLKTWDPFYIFQIHIHKERLQEKFHHPKSHTLWLWQHTTNWFFYFCRCQVVLSMRLADTGYASGMIFALPVSVPAAPPAYFLQPFHSFYPVTTHFSELSLNALWLHSRCVFFLFFRSWQIWIKTAIWLLSDLFSNYRATKKVITLLPGGLQVETWR